MQRLVIHSQLNNQMKTKDGDTRKINVFLKRNKMYKPIFRALAFRSF